MQDAMVTGRGFARESAPGEPNALSEGTAFARGSTCTRHAERLCCGRECRRGRATRHRRKCGQIGIPRRMRTIASGKVATKLRCIEAKLERVYAIVQSLKTLFLREQREDPLSSAASRGCQRQYRRSVACSEQHSITCTDSPGSGTRGDSAAAATDAAVPQCRRSEADPVRHSTEEEEERLTLECAARPFGCTGRYRRRVHPLKATYESEYRVPGVTACSLPDADALCCDKIDSVQFGEMNGECLREFTAHDDDVSKHTPLPSLRAAAPSSTWFTVAPMADSSPRATPDPPSASAGSRSCLEHVAQAEHQLCATAYQTPARLGTANTRAIGIRQPQMHFTELGGERVPRAIPAEDQPQPADVGRPDAQLTKRELAQQQTTYQRAEAAPTTSPNARKSADEDSTCRCPSCKAFFTTLAGSYPPDMQREIQRCSRRARKIATTKGPRTPPTPKFWRQIEFSSSEESPTRL